SQRHIELLEMGKQRGRRIEQVFLIDKEGTPVAPFRRECIAGAQERYLQPAISNPLLLPLCPFSSSSLPRDVFPEYAVEERLTRLARSRASSRPLSSSKRRGRAPSTRRSPSHPLGDDRTAGYFFRMLIVQAEPRPITWASPTFEPSTWRPPASPRRRHTISTMFATPAAHSVC